MQDRKGDGRRIVLTGGPGSGKSTLLAALADKGLATAPEAGRAVIRDEVAHGGTALPWRDRVAFARRMFDHDRRAYAEAGPGLTVFDRGLVDVVGYLRLEELVVPADVEAVARTLRYDEVFIAPPWPEIYGQDAERRQTPEVAERTWAAMVDAYRDFGYRPVELPRAAIAERCVFVLQRIGAAG